MSNFKRELLSALNEKKLDDKTLNKLSKYQSNLMKNYSNPVFNKEDKNKLLNLYNILQEIGKSIYRYNMLKSNNINVQEEQTNLENIVLKGSISNVKYVWHSDHNEHTCNECLELDGNEFDMFDEVPERPHPNCKCYIEIVEYSDNNSSTEEEPCDCWENLTDWLYMCKDACIEADSMQISNENSKNLLSEIISNVIKTDLSTFELNINEAKLIVSEAIDSLTDIFLQVTKSIEIFAENYKELTQLKEDVGHYVDLSAEYYHSKANCEATQLGDVGEKTANLLGILRELFDIPKELLFKGQTIEQALNNSLHDLQVNEEGRRYGKEYPNKDCHIILDDKIKVNWPQNR